MGLGFALAVPLLGHPSLNRYLEQLTKVRPVVLLVWFLPMFALLGLALTAALRGWPWPVRLLLHAGWVLGAVVPTVLYWNL
jgi:hypothetical protein